MKSLSHFFFYTYIGLVLLAGFWGAFVAPALDHRWLFKLDTSTLNEFSRINLISQYRFLRAIEMGFGLFTLLFRIEIFTMPKFNRLFLFIMLSGVLARAVSLAVEGNPSPCFWFFLLYELIGFVVIAIFTNSPRYARARY